MVSFFRKAVSAMEGLVALLLSGGGIRVAELSVFAAELSVPVEELPLLLPQAVKQMTAVASAGIKNIFFMICLLKTALKTVPAAGLRREWNNF